MTDDPALGDRAELYVILPPNLEPALAKAAQRLLALVLGAIGVQDGDGVVLLLEHVADAVGAAAAAERHRRVMVNGTGAARAVAREHAKIGDNALNNLEFLLTAAARHNIMLGLCRNRG